MIVSAIAFGLVVSAIVDIMEAVVATGKLLMHLVEFKWLKTDDALGSKYLVKVEFLDVRAAELNELFQGLNFSAEPVVEDERAGSLASENKLDVSVDVVSRKIDHFANNYLQCFLLVFGLRLEFVHNASLVSVDFFPQLKVLRKVVVSLDLCFLQLSPQVLV